MKRYLAFILALILFSACHNAEKKLKPATYNGLTTGKINHVQLTSDTSQSYELYLPLSYRNQGRLPIIFGFDAHGNGKKLAAWLKPYAGKYGYIVAVTNSFRNNVPNLDAILSQFFSDVNSRITYDKKRQYTAGFSGGARVAYYLAAEDKRFIGVAMLSAGITSLPYMQNKNFSVISFAGWKDFNMTEIRGNSRKLAQQYNIPYLTVYFEGGHEYPPQYMAELVFLWFDLRAMQQGLIKKDRKIIRRTRKLIDSMLAATSDPMMKYDIYSMAITMLSGVSDTKKYQKQQDNLVQTPEFKQAARIVTNFFNLEAMLQPQYFKLIFKRDTAWWHNEINHYNKKIQTDTNRYRLYFYYRMKGYLGIIFFSVADQMARKGDIEKLHKVLLLYQMLEPDNPDVYFYWTCYWLDKGDKLKAKQMFDKSRKLGFNEFARLKYYPCFQNLDKEFFK